MMPLINKELVGKRKSLLAYSLAGLGFIWLYIAMYPSLQTQAADLAKLYKSLPQNILKAFGAEGTGLENVEALLATKQFGLVWPVMAIFLMLSRSAGYIAGEIEQNTIGSLLVQPFSRARIFLSKYYAGVLTLLIFVLLTTLPTIPIAQAYNLDISIKYELLFTVICMVYGLALLGAGMLVSSLSEEKSRVYSILGGTIVFMFVINIISGLQPSLDKLKYLSIFYHFNAGQIIVGHHINAASVLIFAVAAVICPVIALNIFKKRDIAI